MDYLSISYKRLWRSQWKLGFGKSATKPTSSNGIDRLKVEKLWNNLTLKNNLPIQIFRLAGIYSKNFNVLKRLKLGEVKLVDKENHFFPEYMLKILAIFY